MIEYRYFQCSTDEVNRQLDYYARNGWMLFSLARVGQTVDVVMERVAETSDVIPGMPG